MAPSLAVDVSQLRRVQGQRSLLAFAKLYLPDHISVTPSPAHLEVYELLMALFQQRGAKLAIAAPRGFGKSTLVTLIAVLYGICYRQDQFIVILSATAAQAIHILDSIKHELTVNRRLLTDFPELDGPRPSPWTRAELETPTHVRVLALGAGQRIRGRKVGRHRPSLVIADDLEKAESTFSAELREQLKGWFNSAVLKVGSEGTNYVFLGTLYHPYCLLAEYIDPNAHPEWTKRVYKAVTGWASRQDLWDQWAQIYNSRQLWQGAQGPQAARTFYEGHREAMDEGVRVLWPQRWSYYDLMVEHEEDPVSFNSERQNEPVNPRDCLFNVEEFSYWDRDYPSVDALRRALEGDDILVCGACDPSLGHDSLRGDNTAIVVVLYSERTHCLYVVEADIQRYTPAQTVEAIFAHYQRYRFNSFAIEANQFQELLAQEVERRGRELGLYLPIERVTHTRDKVLRLQGLQPWLKNGTVRMSHAHTKLLEECRFFPRGRYDDGLDALEMAIRQAERYGRGPFIHIIGPDGGEDPEGWNVKWETLE